MACIKRARISEYEKNDFDQKIQAFNILKQDKELFLRQHQALLNSLENKANNLNEISGHCKEFTSEIKVYNKTTFENFNLAISYLMNKVSNDHIVLDEMKKINRFIEKKLIIGKKAADLCLNDSSLLKTWNNHQLSTSSTIMSKVSGEATEILKRAISLGNNTISKVGGLDDFFDLSFYDIILMIIFAALATMAAIIVKRFHFSPQATQTLALEAIEQQPLGTPRRVSFSSIDAPERYIN